MKIHPWLMIAGLLGVGYIALHRLPDAIQPSPAVNTEVSDVAAKAGRAYLVGLAESFDDAAKSRSEDQQIHAELIAANREARRTAFAPVDEVLQTMTPENRSETLKSVANGLRKAAKEKWSWSRNPRRATPKRAGS